MLTHRLHYFYQDEYLPWSGVLKQRLPMVKKEDRQWFPRKLLSVSGLKSPPYRLQWPGIRDSGLHLLPYPIWICRNPLYQIHLQKLQGQSDCHLQDGCKSLPVMRQIQWRRNGLRHTQACLKHFWSLTRREFRLCRQSLPRQNHRDCNVLCRTFSKHIVPDLLCQRRKRKSYLQNRKKQVQY